MIQRRDMSNPAAPAPLVQEAAGVVPVPGNVEQSQQVVQQAPQQQNVVQPQQPVNVFSGGSGQPTTFENMPVTVGWTPTGKPVYEGSKAQQSWQTTNPRELEGSMPSYASLGLSKPLGAGDVSNVQPLFQKDDSKRDGGFFGWLGGLVKNRPGRRPGESDDEYDERMTRNNMRIATLADAIRHMGNIYNTMKGGPAQQFNSPAAVYEQQMQQRKAERKSKLAAAAESAYKDAQLQLKMDAANTDKAYKAMNLELKKDAGRRADESAKAMNEYRKGQLGIQEGNLKLSEKRLGETMRHNRASEGLSASRLALSRAKANGGSKGSGKGLGSVTNLSTPYGHLNRKKDLNTIEKRQILDYLFKNGFITDAAAKKYERAVDERARGVILNGWIGWAANAKGPGAEKFRKTLIDHYGYAPTYTVGGGKAPTAPAKSKNNAKPKKGGWASGFKL